MIFKTGLLLSLISTSVALGDWPQWRGPARNGTAIDSPALIDHIPKSGLPELWESAEIPSMDEGGLSSPVAVGGRVFVAVVWHHDVPSERRQIDALVLRQLGFENAVGLSEELIADMERARESIPPTLRGKALHDFTAQWIEEHFDAHLKEVYGPVVVERFAKGPLAIPLAIFRKLYEHRAHVLAGDAEMRAWLAQQGWPAEFREQIATAVPATIRRADDTLVCLDLTNGATLWKTTLPGEPLGRRASATPCVDGGKVFTVGSARVWCLDAASGKTLWETPLTSERGVNASPLVVDGAVIVNADALIAYEAATGIERWRRSEAGGTNSSPVAWTARAY